MAIPERVDVKRSADYLALISRAVFQAGLSWALIEKKWPAYERLFEGFDPTLVAAFGEAEIERLSTDATIVRTRKKIAATVDNARMLLELERRPEGFRGYLHGFDSYNALSVDLRKRFKFLGELGVYYFLFRIREPVPIFEEWEKTIPGDHPRMREMVALARSRGEL